ncbi:cell division control protein cdc6 [Plasmopara halstedii]|uniref:Cell division control protein cdc6 n=1 Tax=Plasmopara halstedii TaxID=4781 RepID=A0A0P1AW42_PLAHL|nr:cell division control protein cdc6 [Plasmopara halstedii]CEG46220.1 cell division control protein cdc6 [Plasmopara halstedii]|eukprot:XP_024582589.1 cell division control protein cdc6 [Plasmopara halstedii]
MRTRAQKRESMPELAQQLKRRLRALEVATVNISTSHSPPALKKRKLDDVSTSPLLLTPHVPKSKIPSLSAVKTSRGPNKLKKGDNKQRKLCRTLEYTKPAKLDPVDAPQTILQRLCSQQMACGANAIVGRLKEHQSIRNVLRNNAKHGSSLFIIGPPGTGKSSSVNELLIKEGFESVAPCSIKERNFVETSNKIAVKLNCSTYTDPAALYAVIEQLVKSSTRWIVPGQLDPFTMDNFIKALNCDINGPRDSIAIVLDEVDHLLRLPVRMQPKVKELLRFFVRWAAIAPHLVKFLCIMNGVDMYEHVSRIHVTGSNADSQVPRVVFSSYTHEELKVILLNYVQSTLSTSAKTTEVTTYIETRAMELIARKVAAREGDARLAISLLQQSARYALQRYNSQKKESPIDTQVKIMIRDVFQCATTMLSSPSISQIKRLPRQAKLLLYVITTLAPCRDTSNKKKSFRKCDMNHVSEELERLRKQPQTSWIPRLSRDELQTHLTSLSCYALVRQLSSKHGDQATSISTRTFWTSKVFSCVSMSEVSCALQDDTSLSQLLL